MITIDNRRGMGSFLVVLMLWVSAASANWSPPDEHAATIQGLDNAQREFLMSGAVLDIIPERQLLHELATRENDELVLLLNDLMAAAAEMGYSPERDMGAIPLNLTTEGFVRFIPTPEGLREAERAPGPFSVSRYLYPKSGVPTFGGASVAIWPEDLVAGDVDIAIMGVPSNLGSGNRDSGWSPDRMRALNTISRPDVQSLVKPFEALSVVDYGDVFVDGMSAERSVALVSTLVAETTSTGAVPMMVGGDTSVLYPGVLGVANHHGNETFGLLHLSAHPDAERHGDHTLSDRQSIYRLLEDNVVAGDDTVLLGLRGPDVDADTLQWLRDQGVRYHTMAEVRQRGYDNVLRRVLREVSRGPDAFFVSIDVSALAPTDMIAAGRVEANGLSIEQATQTIRQVCASKVIVGFEITDLAPMMDLSDRSVLHANAVLNACLVGIAVRKSGLDADYVHPLALDHGQR